MGGKFANLVRLTKAGAKVPPAFAVSTFAFRKFMAQLGPQVSTLLGKVTDDISSAEDVSMKIASLVAEAPVPKETVDNIKGAYEELRRGESGDDDLVVAVRSSATAEDMLTSSVAGQHETFLGVKGAENVVESVKKCWASTFATRSLSYRRARGISEAGVEMAVVVQKMVAASKSGVMFTLNPANGDPSKISIDATWGLGEAEVSGVVTPDLFLVDKVTMEILTKKVGSKQVEFVASRDRVERREVPDERRKLLCLGEDEVLELARAGKSIEKAFGKPQDIEWAIEGLGTPGGLYFLQARPETVWSAKAPQRTSGKGTLDMIVDVMKRGQKLESE